MKTKIVCMLTICFFMLSCAKKVDEAEGKGISVKKTSKECKLNDLYSDFEILTLKTGDEGVFRDINKLMIHDGCYYILDKTGKRRVLVFDADGKYKHSIGNAGKGKGEYVNIEDFTIDKENRRVVILAYPSTVYVYNLDGSFVQSKKIEKNTMLWNIASYANGFICSTNHMTYTEGKHAFLFYFFDKDFGFTDKQIPVLPVQMQIPPLVSNVFNETDDGEYIYFDVYDSSVYTINTDGRISVSKKKLVLDNYMPYEKFANTSEFMSEQSKYDYFFRAVYADGQLHSYFASKNRLYGVLTDLKSNSIEAFRYVDWMPDLLYQKDGVIYSSVSVRQVMENRELFGQNQIDSIRNQSNDLILKFRCKAMD